VTIIICSSGTADGFAPADQDGRTPTLVEVKCRPGRALSTRPATSRLLEITETRGADETITVTTATACGEAVPGDEGSDPRSSDGLSSFAQRRSTPSKTAVGER
jgi:hypothetical protein